MTSKAEKKITHWMARHGIDFLRVSLGIIFIWFGFLKYFPGLSPIEDLAVRTTSVLTFSLFSEKITYIGLATLECFIGVGLLIGKYLNNPDPSFVSNDRDDCSCFCFPWRSI